MIKGPQAAFSLHAENRELKPVSRHSSSSAIWDLDRTVRLSASYFPRTSACKVCPHTPFRISRSRSGSRRTHGLNATVAASHGPPALISSHSTLPFRACFWAPSWGPWPWESRAQRAHNPIWQEMVGMPGYIHSRTHSPTCLAQRLLLKAGALTSVHTFTYTRNKKMCN